MSKLKQLQLEIAHLIDHVADQERVVDLFISVKTGGASAAIRNKAVRTIVDLKNLYGKKLDEAVTILHEAQRRMDEQDQETPNNLTTSKNVPNQSNADQHEKECGK